MSQKKVIDLDGLKVLKKQIASDTETRIDKRIVTAMSEDSTNDTTPGALAVYQLVTSLLGGTHTVCVEPVDELPEVGRDNVIYIVKAEDAVIYDMYLYNENAWVGLGKMEVNLSNYWSKDELTVLTNDEIQAIFDETEQTA